MKKMLIALAATAGLLVASGAVAVPASATEAASVQTAKKKYTTKQKNQYWNAVRRTEPTDARIIGKKDTIAMGVSVCNLLRAGGTLTDLSILVLEADPIIEDFLIVSMATAPVYLCPDQDYKFD
jgi:hypothetical protein